MRVCVQMKVQDVSALGKRVSKSCQLRSRGQERQELYERNKSCLRKLLTHIFSKTISYTCDSEVDEDVWRCLLPVEAVLRINNGDIVHLCSRFVIVCETWRRPAFCESCE